MSGIIISKADSDSQQHQGNPTAKQEMVLAAEHQDVGYSKIGKLCISCANM